MTITAVQNDTAPAFSIRQPHISDEAWALIAPLLSRAAATGRSRKWALRLLLEAVLYLLRTGCQWRALPATFPPYSTVQRHFYGWRDGELFERLSDFLVMSDRERDGHEAAPTAGVIDSQSVKTSEIGGTKGYDSGKKIMGLKRHILVDTTGRLLGAWISPTDLHDSRAAVHLLQASRRSWPFVEKVWADAAYCGDRVRTATSIRVEIVTGPPNQRGLIVRMRRWVAERSLAWVGRNRRVVKDYERPASTAFAFVFLAAARVLMKRLAPAK